MPKAKNYVMKKCVSKQRSLLKAFVRSWFVCTGVFLNSGGKFRGLKFNCKLVDQAVEASSEASFKVEVWFQKFSDVPLN